MMNHPEDVNKQLAIIRHILLHGEREEIQKIKEIINNRAEMEERVLPIINDKIDFLKFLERFFFFREYLLHFKGMIFRFFLTFQKT